MIRLEQWVLAPHNRATIFEAPETVISLKGQVYGHPTFSDGEAICTSPIKLIKDGIITTASGKQYELGKPHPDYEAKFPGAKARLLGEYNEAK